MYALEDKLRKKYRAVFEKLPATFLERVRGLDEIRRRRGPLAEFPGRGQELSPQAQTHARLYYLFDASAVIHLYVPDEKLTPRVDHFLEQRALGKAFLFIPNFCVAETFNTLARKHYRKNELDAELYALAKENFAQAMHGGHLFYHYEMSRYHVLDVDLIIPFEHKFLTQRPKGAKKGEEWTLSTFDVLIIAMGMELDRITGGALYIVTCDRRIDDIGRILYGLTPEERQKYSIPDYVRFPRTINLWKRELPELPCVEGQRVG